MNLKRSKNSGFTLMEIMISLAIVAILVAATLPIINKQLEKADEYSYFLAYKTVERMAGQIVTLGDPTELSDSGNIVIADADETSSVKDWLVKKIESYKVNTFFATITTKFAKAEETIFRTLFPKAFAYNYPVNMDLFGWDYNSFDEIWLAYRVCRPGYDPNNTETCIIKSNTTTTVTNEDGSTSQQTTPKCYAPTDEEFDNCKGYTRADAVNDITVNAYIPLELFSSDYCYPSSTVISGIADYLMNAASPDAKSFCESFVRNNCSGSKMISGKMQSVSVSYDAYEDTDVDDSDDDEEGGYLEEGEAMVDPPKSPNAGRCSVTSFYYVDVDESGSSIVPSSKPTFDDSYCSSSYGYYNMDNKSADGATIDCDCKTNYVLSSNDEKVCCSKCSTGEKPYAKSNHSCICCVNDFNKNDGTCCPDYSIYNEGEGACTCIEGYKMVGGECVEDTCTQGSTMVDGVCVVNPPITKATRFCEQVKDYWNIQDSSCTGFTSQNDVSYNKAVYEAALGTNGTLMSIKSQSGAFGLNSNGTDKIKPNIVFGNGLKMWILSDKTSSIPGLSFSTENSSPTRNVCRNLKKSTHISCYNAGGYFCQAEKNCFALDAESTAAMGDARNCCGSVDITDIAAVAQVTADPNAYLKNTQAYAISGFTVFVDINGDKGNGTLWDDVYPFYIASNGVVYPAYPLDAPKNAGTNSALYLGGNSSKQLAVDVYYYEAADDSREKKVAFPGVSFARGVCSARQISKYTPYCLNLGENYSTVGLENKTLTGTDYIKHDDVNATGSEKSYNPCDKYKCFVSVRRKLRAF